MLRIRGRCGGCRRPTRDIGCGAERFDPATQSRRHHLAELGQRSDRLLGHAPTGKRFTVRNVQVLQIVDGKRVERWGSTDELGILQQLGLA